jgi:lysophospholipase L1-like esterase
MDCRRRLRLGSAAAIAAAILCGQAIRSQDLAPPVFQSHPGVAALQCPSMGTTAAPRASGPADRVPTDDDLEASVIDVPRLGGSASSLPVDVVRAFALPKDGERLRIGVWGDSHAAGGFITDELARLAEAKGVSVATSVIPASLGRPGVRLPLRRVCKSDGWKLQSAYGAATPIAVGPALSNLRSSKAGDYVWLDFRHRANQQVRSLQLHYLPSSARAALGIRIDDGAEARFELAGGVLEIRASSSISTLKLRVLRGEVVLHHFTLQHVDPPAVTIDVFGLPSATVKGWSNADPGYLRKSVDTGSYDAVILEYGTNEGAVERFNPAAYASLLAASLKNFRQVFSETSCVLVGPTDRGVRIPAQRRSGRLDLMYYPRVHQQITRIQADVGARFGCALWDWQRYMGGPGSIYRWARETPALAAADLIHLTPAGYRRSAAALAQSLGWLGQPPPIK